MANQRSIDKARVSFGVAIEQALADLNDNFQTLTAQLRNEDIDFENRLNLLFSEKGFAVWGLTRSPLDDMRSALHDFDLIVADSAKGPVLHKIYMEQQNWEGERDPNKLQNLRAAPAVLLRYLKKAQFDLTVEPCGMYFNLVCKR